MARPNAQMDALLAHVFQQTQANVSFLAAQNYITATEASEIMSRLSTAQSRGNTAGADLAASMQNLQVAPAPVAPVIDTGRRNVPPPPARHTVRAKALWAYNEDGRVCTQLQRPHLYLIDYLSGTERSCVLIRRDH